MLTQNQFLDHVAVSHAPPQRFLFLFSFFFRFEEFLDPSFI